LDTKGYAHALSTVKLMPIVIEMLFAVRFGSERETDY
jgi:hypothetical protein